MRKQIMQKHAIRKQTIQKQIMRTLDQRLDKHAQLTIFIIVGLMIILTASITFYLQGKVREEGRTFSPVIDEVPAEFIPLKEFIETCLQDNAEEGLEKIGMHGGYIGLSPDDQQYTGTTFEVDYSGTDPTRFDAISFAPGSAWHIPYWHYLNSRNDCQGDCSFAVQRPPLYRTEGEHSIEEQLDRYVADRFEACVGDWRSFTLQGFRVTADREPTVRTVVGDYAVTFYLTYPLEAASEFGTEKIKNFAVGVNLGLPAIYNLATEILNAQVQSKFLEANTMNIIAGMSGLDDESLPPVAATDFSHSPKYWPEHEVQKQVQDLLSVHLQRFVVAGTNNFDPYLFPNDPVKEGLYQNFILPVQGDYSPLEAEFTYLPLWPVYFDAGPVIISSTGAVSSSVFSWVPIKQYNTPYDISYPVVIGLSDPSAMENKGYHFYYALETNVRNNQAIDETFTPLRKVAADGGSGQFCNPNQRNSGEIFIEVKNQQGEPVQNAAIFFSAGTSCLLGSTDSEGQFVSQFPIGIGALTLAHPDYFSTTIPYATRVAKEDDESITLYEIANVPVSVMKKNLKKEEGKKKGNWMMDFASEPLAEHEMAIVSIDRIRDTPYDEEFTRVVQVRGSREELPAGEFSGESEEPSDEEFAEETIELVPGKYQVSMQLIAEDTYITIPKTKICKKILGGVSEKCVTVPTIQLAEGTFAAGATEIPNWEVRTSDLVNADGSITQGIEFNVINFDIYHVPESLRHPEDLEEMGKLQEYAAQYRNELLPRFRR